ncbi:MAG: hypothetical protein QGH45_19575 [Myxococcota bacterium]|jgi:hypothetical protein|nr:hypothetical protein [Myxococcota bacterium]
MRTTVLLTLAATMLLGLSGCPTGLHDDDTGDDDSAAGDDDSGADDDTTAGDDDDTTGFELSVGPEETASAVSGLSRPSVALDSLGQPHIVADMGNPQVYILHRLGGDWQEELFAEWTAQVDASRVYLPHIEIDGSDRAWVSAWLGVKDGGNTPGQGVWLVTDVASQPESTYLGVANAGTKNGNLALDPADPGRAIVMAKTGLYELFDGGGSTGETGQFAIGDSGEKLRFLVRARDGEPGIWHAVMSGYSLEPSRYRNSGMESRVTWADYDAYDGMGEDMLHPGLGVDGADPWVGYMAIRYHPGVVFNIWDGEGLVFDPSDLPVLDPSPASHSNSGERFGPQFAPAPGRGAFVCWTGGDGWVRLSRLTPDGSRDEPLSVAEGASCTITAGPDGALHMAYVRSQLRYRRIDVH